MFCHLNFNCQAKVKSKSSQVQREREKDLDLSLLYFQPTTRHTSSYATTILPPMPPTINFSKALNILPDVQIRNMTFLMDPEHLQTHLCIMKGSNSKMEDRGVLDKVPDVQS